MWNYYLPGFMSSCLIHEGEHEIVEEFVWSLRKVPVLPCLVMAQSPWWGGTVPMESYRVE